MGACTSAAAEDSTEFDPSLTPSRGLSAGKPISSPSMRAASHQPSSASDPPSATDTNGARSAAAADADLHGIILEPVLSPPINQLIKSTSTAAARRPSAASPGPFAPSATTGGFIVAPSPWPATALHPPADGDGRRSTVQAAPMPVSSPPVHLVESRLAQEHAVALHPEAITDLAIANDEATITGSADKSAVIYNWRTRATERWTHHAKTVERVLFCPRLGHVFSGSRDSTVRQWRGGQQKEVQVYRGHTLPVTAMLLGPGDSLITGSRDYSLRRWHVDTGAQSSMHTHVHNIVTCLKWIAPGGTFAQNGSFVSPSIVAPGGPPAVVDEFGFDASAGFDAYCFLQGSEDPLASVRIWDARTMEVSAAFRSAGGDKIVRSVASDPTDANRFVAVTSASDSARASGGHPHGGGEIRLWDRRRVTSNIALGAQPVEPLLSILAHADSINAAVYLPAAAHSMATTDSSATFLVTASNDKTLKVWDLSASTSSRCVQVVQYRDRDAIPHKASAPPQQRACEFTALALTSRPISADTISQPAGAAASSSASSSALHHVLYAGTSQGLVSAWMWDTSKGGARREGRLELVAQTKATSTLSR